MTAPVLAPPSQYCGKVLAEALLGDMHRPK
jgi:hypothetical protein